MPQDSFRVVTPDAVGETVNRDDLQLLLAVALDVGRSLNPRLVLCPVREGSDLRFSVGDLLIEPAIYPARDVCLKRLEGGPEKAVNGRNVEERIVPNVAPYLADSDLGVGDAGNLLGYV